MGCPVERDLHRYLTDQDRQDAYLEAIAERALQIVETGDLDLLRDAMTPRELEGLRLSWGVLRGSATDLSLRMAESEIRTVIMTAAKRIAEREFDREMREAVKEISMHRYRAMIAKYEEMK